MDDGLILNFRFAVSFLQWGVLNSTVDTRFQNVSGLSAEVTTTSVEEGGLNLYSHKLPQRVSYGNLTLTRGKFGSYRPDSTGSLPSLHSSNGLRYSSRSFWPRR